MTRLPKDNSTIFRHLAENRREAAEAANDWAVYRLTKRGRPAKRPDLTCRTEAEAMEGAERMTRLNPGTTFVHGPKR